MEAAAYLIISEAIYHPKINYLNIAHTEKGQN